MMRTVYARDYGILPDGSDASLTRQICKMAEENPSNVRFVLEPGTYHFYPEDAVKRAVSVSNSDQAEIRCFGVFLEDLENVSLDCQGAVFCFHGDMTPLAVSGCSRVEVKNLKITSAIPHGAESLILQASEEVVEIRINRGKFPYCIADEKLYFLQEGQKEPIFAAMEFDADTNRVRSGAGDTFPQVKAYESGENTVRLEGNFRVVPTPGNLLALRHGKRVHPGMLVQDSEDVLVENVTIYQTAGLGIVFQFSRNITARGIEFTADHTDGCRIISGHDDGLHFSNNGGHITIENCRFRGLMDDPVNVHGTAAGIRQISGSRRLTGVYCHSQSAGFERWAKPGDVIAFLRPQDRSLAGTARALSYRLITPAEFELELEDDIPEGADTLCSLENLTNTPSVLCRNNYFGSCRARGILVTTPGRVQIEDNIFESSGSAVTITGDVREWYESGTCTDVSVRRNQFLNCCTSVYQFCDGVIHIEPSVDAQSDKMVHRNIRIENNLFAEGEETLLFADHTGKIQFCGNSIFAGGAAVPRVVLQKCRDVRVEGNDIINFPDRYLQTERR
ncbi:MAG TPA: right-handed parallel beta-helix repeat-containing protein [Candidatus Egerieimonas faecigallinarum]|nr:right-handed parallel beta-helix repeat-containing protein [Candidatus Egerieimonas faecigallinarum]